jgi:hypothetical protein
LLPIAESDGGGSLAGRLAKDYTMQGWSGLQPFGVAKLTAVTNIMISA